MSGYAGALEAAGVTVHDCTTFGSYQGDWIADVTMPDGRRGIIRGSYGSCSGCDAFEAEVGSDYHGWETGDAHDAATKPVEGCEQCAEYHAKLKAFGADYLDGFVTAEEVAAAMAADEYWSSYSETKEQAEYVLARCNAGSAEADALRARIVKFDVDDR